eukprot:7752949-Alexandrium_andersonii.AAC.1
MTLIVPGALTGTHSVVGHDSAHAPAVGPVAKRAQGLRGNARFKVKVEQAVNEFPGRCNRIPVR